MFYGNGNIHPTHPDLYMTTFNAKAQKGVNPHTIMKAKIKDFIWAEYGSPRIPDEKATDEPVFYSNQYSVPKSRRNQVKGPLWANWPADSSYPHESYDVLQKAKYSK